jgi:hypothetical protein
MSRCLDVFYAAEMMMVNVDMLEMRKKRICFRVYEFIVVLRIIV